MRVIFLILCFCVFLKSNTANSRYFGWDGASGSPGFNGANGQSGQDLTIFAQGQIMNLDLRGENGQDGSQGGDGASAYNCHPPFRPDYNLWGASGGDGGRGGAGGHGGNGGNPIIYYTNNEDLKRLTIDSSPGLGGRGASGGRGSNGCYCREYNWSIQRCWYENGPGGVQQQRCRWERYSCQDGRKGIDSPWGQSPGPGKIGSATLIRKDTPLDSDILNQKVNFSEALESLPVLAINQWSIRSGLLSLLGSGSRISDSYKNFEGRRFYPVRFEWESKNPIHKFYSDQFSISLSSNRVAVDAHPSIWMETLSETGANNDTRIIFKKVVHENEAVLLSSEFRGSGKQIMLEISDRASVSDILSSSIEMHLEADHFLIFDKTLFKGKVPERFIRRFSDKIEVLIGEMDINEKYLKPGEDLILDMTIERSMGYRRASKHFEQKHAIQ
jgi:hypothetical protein